MTRYAMRTVIVTLILVFAASVNVSVSQAGSNAPAPPKTQSTAEPTAPLTARNAAERTLTAIVTHDTSASWTHPDIQLRFKDLRTAFNTLRDSAKSGYPAERYTLLVEPGTYRLRKPLVWIEEKDSVSGHEFIMQPSREGDVFISGAELNREGKSTDRWGDMTNWSVVDSSLHRYSTEWPYAFGLVDKSHFASRYQRWMTNTDEPEHLQRRDVVIINGTLLQPHLEHEELVPGSFKVVEGQDGKPGRLTIQLADPLDDHDIIEIPVTENLLILRRLNRVSITGISFIHANPFIGNNAVIISGTSSVQLTDCRFNDHSWKGLSISRVPLPLDRTRADSIEIVSCQANGNGGMGMGLSFIARVRMQDCELAYNTWRGRAAGTEGWAVGGTKLFHVHDVTISNLHAHDNQSSGLWLDTDCARIRVENCLLENNSRDGLFIEACQGPIEVVNNRILNNGRDGLRNNSSNNLTIENNRFEFNMAGHVCFAAKNRTFSDFEGGQELTVKALNNLFHDNQFLGEPIWYAERWLIPDGSGRYVRNTRFVNNAAWPYDADNPFCQKPLPEEMRTPTQTHDTGQLR